MPHVSHPMCSFTPCMQYGNTALIIAAKEGYESLVRLLLQHKANVNHADKVPQGEGEGGWGTLLSGCMVESAAYGGYSAGEGGMG